MLVKGAPEAVLGHCTAMLSDPENGNDTTKISDAAMTELHDLVQSYSRRSLRVIVLAHADLYEVPSSRTSSPSPGEDSDDPDSERLPDEMLRRLLLSGREIDVHEFVRDIELFADDGNATGAAGERESVECEDHKRKRSAMGRSEMSCGLYSSSLVPIAESVRVRTPFYPSD